MQIITQNLLGNQQNAIFQKKIFNHCLTTGFDSKILDYSPPLALIQTFYLILFARFYKKTLSECTDVAYIHKYL